MDRTLRIEDKLTSLSHRHRLVESSSIVDTYPIRCTLEDVAGLLNGADLNAAAGIFRKHFPKRNCSMDENAFRIALCELYVLYSDATCLKQIDAFKLKRMIKGGSLCRGLGAPLRFETIVGFLIMTCAGPLETRIFNAFQLLDENGSGKLDVWICFRVLSGMCSTALLAKNGAGKFDLLCAIFRQCPHSIFEQTNHANVSTRVIVSSDELENVFRSEDDGRCIAFAEDWVDLKEFAVWIFHAADEIDRYEKSEERQHPFPRVVPTLRDQLEKVHESTTRSLSKGRHESSSSLLTLKPASDPDDRFDDFEPPPPPTDEPIIYRSTDVEFGRFEGYSTGNVLTTPAGREQEYRHERNVLSEDLGSALNAYAPPSASYRAAGSRGSQILKERAIPTNLSAIAHNLNVRVPDTHQRRALEERRLLHVPPTTTRSPSHGPRIAVSKGTVPISVEDSSDLLRSIKQMRRDIERFHDRSWR